MPNLHIITGLLILLNIIVSFKGFNDFIFFNKYKFQVGAIQRGQIARVITSGFLHIDIRHLIFDCFVLYYISDVVIINFGNLGFFLTYFLSSIVGGVITLNYKKKDFQYSSVGSGTSICGILFSNILINFNQTFELILFKIDIPLYFLGIIFMIYTLYGAYKDRLNSTSGDRHAFIGNFGGIITGLILAIIFKPKLIYELPILLLLLFIFIIFVFLFFQKKKD
tara:strand:+ start:6401 stop:7069 length:669 start_codon:yes stop_codon:yes gene_type:complete